MSTQSPQGLYLSVPDLHQLIHDWSALRLSLYKSQPDSDHPLYPRNVETLICQLKNMRVNPNGLHLPAYPQTPLPPARDFEGHEYKYVSLIDNAGKYLYSITFMATQPPLYGKEAAQLLKGITDTRHALSKQSVGVCAHLHDLLKEPEKFMRHLSTLTEEQACTRLILERKYLFMGQVTPIAPRPRNPDALVQTAYDLYRDAVYQLSGNIYSPPALKEI